MAFNDTGTTAVELASKRHRLLGRDAQSDYHNEILAETILLRILTSTDNEAMLQSLTAIWDSIMGAAYTNLKIANLQLFLAGWHADTQMTSTAPTLITRPLPLEAVVGLVPRSLVVPSVSLVARRGTRTCRVRTCLQSWS